MRPSSKPLTSLLAGMLALISPAILTQGQTQFPVGIGINNTIYNNSALLNIPQIAKELDLTDSQRARLKALDLQTQKRAMHLKKQFTDQQDQFTSDPSTPASSSPLREEFGLMLKAGTEQHEASIKKILDDRQWTRLSQIRYQTLGPRFFTLPEVQKRLNLDPVQIEKIRTIVAKGAKERRAALKVPDEFTSSRDANIAFKNSYDYKVMLKAAQTSSQNVRVRTMQSIGKVLTQGQRKNYQKMIGAPFDLSGLWDKQDAKPTDKTQSPSALKR